MALGCLACELSSGERELVGGRIYGAASWVVEHCVGPLGVGTLLVKPLRHCLCVADLNEEEVVAMGPLLRAASACVRELAKADQVYVCLWSHAGWQPGHVHFVVQPSWAHLESRYNGPGPSLQREMFEAAEIPPRAEVEVFCDRARSWFARHAALP